MSFLSSLVTDSVSVVTVSSAVIHSKTVLWIAALAPDYSNRLNVLLYPEMHFSGDAFNILRRTH